jgi:hypothetical protein
MASNTTVDVSLSAGQLYLNGDSTPWNQQPLQASALADFRGVPTLADGLLVVHVCLCDCTPEPVCVFVCLQWIGGNLLQMTPAAGIPCADYEGGVNDYILEFFADSGAITSMRLQGFSDPNVHWVKL